jgi:hypothetical protein
VSCLVLNSWFRNSNVLSTWFATTFLFICSLISKAMFLQKWFQWLIGAINEVFHVEYSSEEGGLTSNTKRRSKILIPWYPHFAKSFRKQNVFTIKVCTAWLTIGFPCKAQC